MIPREADEQDAFTVIVTVSPALTPVDDADRDADGEAAKTDKLDNNTKINAIEMIIDNLFIVNTFPKMFFGNFTIYI